MRESTKAKLDEISELGYNWDSYRAAPPGEGAVQASRIIAEAMFQVGLPEPNLIPMSDGGIAFEFYGDNGGEFSFSVDSDGVLWSAFAWLADETSWESTPSLDKAP